MREAHAIEPEPLTELMTWKQICGRYPDQWVALVEMDGSGRATLGLPSIDTNAEPRAGALSLVALERT